jgi:hypothetical protein
LLQMVAWVAMFTAGVGGGGAPCGAIAVVMRTAEPSAASMVDLPWGGRKRALPPKVRCAE